MKHSLQSQIRIVRFFGSVKTRMSVPKAIHHNLRAPFTLVCADTKQTQLVGFGGFAHVLQIAKTRNLTKVAKTVVALVAVYVVNMLRRPFASDVSPRQSMRKLFTVMYGYRPIPRRMFCSGAFTDKIGSLFVRNPCKDTRVRIVRQRRHQMFNGARMFGCHDNAFTIGLAQ